MAKKILKRSLALGALMAFVITGNAMAAELTSNDYNGTEVLLKDGLSYDLGASDEVTIKSSSITTIANNATITVNDNQTLNLISTADGGAYTGVLNGNVVINGNGNIYVSQKVKMGNGLCSESSNTDHVSITANSITVSADKGCSIYAEENDRVELVAKEISMLSTFTDGSANAAGVCASSGANVSVTGFETLNINVQNISDDPKEGGPAINNIAGSTVTVSGNEANLYSEGRAAISVLSGSHTSIDVKSLNVATKSLAGTSGARKVATLAAESSNSKLEINVSDKLTVTDNDKDGTFAINAKDGSIVEIKGTADIDINGNVYGESLATEPSSKIGIEGKTVSIIGDVKSNYAVINITGATEINSKISNDGDRVVNAINGGQITFAGESTKIKGEGTVTGKAFAVVAEGTSDKKSVINFNAKTTEITLDDKGGGSWSYGVDAKANSKIEFNGEDVTINDHKETYTAQNVTVRKNAEIDFNNTGTTNINTTSKASVTGIDVKEGGVLNFNKGKVNVVSSIQSSSGEGSINAIGIQVHDDAVSKLNVNEGVSSFVVQVNGQGYDYNGTSYSSGTAALKVSDKSTANINSKTANFQVLFNGNASGDATHNMAYALWTTDTAQISIGSNTVTDVSVTKSGPQAGIAIGVYANGGKIDLKGDTTVNASGIDESNALKADSNGVMNIGSAGRAVSLTGDVVSDGGTINVTGAGVELNGNIKTLNSGEATIGGEAVNFTGKALTNGGTTKLSLGKGTWNITDASTLTDVTFGAGSTLMIDDGSKYTDGNYAVTASGKAEVEDGAKLIVNGVKEETYNIVKAGTINGKWAESDITIDNALMSYEWSAEDDSKLDLVVKPKSADEITNSTGVNSSTGSMLSDVVNMASSEDYNKGDNAGVDFIVNAMAGQASGNTPEGAGTAINSALQIGEAGGNSGTALSVVNNVAGVTTQRLSFSQMNTAPQGGHGKVERKYKSGAGVWAQYMHGKDKVEDMPMDSLKSSYESQYNGAVIGYDFKEVGKTQTGIAFNYGEGDSHSTGGSIATRSDFDFWGIGLYHNIMNDDTNLILDVNYSKSDSDVTQINGGTTLTANPETTTLSAGVKFEKLIQNGPVQIVPYAGLRFMSVDTDDYAANIAGKKAFMYAPDRQNIWLIPVGVSLR